MYILCADVQCIRIMYIIADILYPCKESGVHFILLFDFHIINITLNHKNNCCSFHDHKPLTSITNNVFRLTSKASLTGELQEHGNPKFRA